MTKTQLEPYVKGQFGMSLNDFLKQKIEVEAFYDYEIAGILNSRVDLIRNLRNDFGIKKANGFPRRFERAYGKGAVEAFKEMVENLNNSLSDVARHFGFSREYARQVYRKIYRSPYTEMYKRKRKARNIEFAHRRRKSKQIDAVLKVGEKVKSMGLSSSYITNKGCSHIILGNGLKLKVKSTSRPIRIDSRKEKRR
ncbi:MAG: hypothetical protein JRJ86_22545 [Deltaproteobacteria bacterium]|nr:hypothetical protein [Deltaproteobacteria bacterium]